MPRIELASLGPSPVMYASGAVRPGVAGTVKFHVGGANVDVWTAETGGASSPGTFTTDSQGRIPGWIDRQALDELVDVQVAPAAPITVLVPGTASIVIEAPSGSVLPAQSTLQFAGAGVTVADDPTNNRTVVTIPGGGGGGGTVPLDLFSAALTDPVLLIGQTGHATFPTLKITANGHLHFGDEFDDPANVQLVLDNNRESRTALAVYPENGQTNTIFSVYGGDLVPDGTGVAGGYSYVQSQADRSEWYMGADWNGSSPAYIHALVQSGTQPVFEMLAGGSTGAVRLLGPSGSPGSGLLELIRDTALDKKTIAALVSSGVLGWQMDYTGSMFWSPSAGNGVQLSADDPIFGGDGLFVYPRSAGSAAEFDVTGGDVRPGAPGSRGTGGFRAQLYADNTVGRVRVGYYNPVANSFGGIAALESGSPNVGLTTSDASGTVDTHFVRAAAGVWQIPEHGGGIKLTSPDGTQTKQIQLSNAGALVLV